MRILILFLSITGNLALQSTLFKYIEIIGIRPNTALLAVVSYAILRGDTEGAAFGFFAGLTQDFYFGQLIGMNALLYMTLGYACGKPFRDFFRETIFFPLILGFLCVFSYSLVYYFINFMLMGKLDFFYYLRRIILPETVYSVALALPVYRLMYTVNDFLERREARGRQLFRGERGQ